MIDLADLHLGLSRLTSRLIRDSHLLVLSSSLTFERQAAFSSP